MRVRNPNVQMILESHVREWFIKEKGKRERKRQPPITISRQRGSGGLWIAQRLSEKLGWPYYDKNIIKEIAHISGVDEKTVAFLDERDRDTFREFANIFSQDRAVSQHEYVEHLKRFIGTLGKAGRTIIVGRGANFILPPNDALRVRLIGEPETCIRFAAREYSLDEAEVAKLLPTWDREQHTFIKRYFGEDITDPRHYDMVINITYVGLEGAVDLILSAYARKFPRGL